MNSGSSQTDEAARTLIRQPVAMIILGVMAVAYSIHTGLFALRAEPSSWEAAYTIADSGQTIYTRVLNLWCGLVGESLLSARLFSIACGLGALLLIARLAARWGGDGPAAAALTLGFVMFPAAAYGYALATPDSLTGILFVLAVTLATTPENKQDVFQSNLRQGLAGLSAGLLLALHPLGWILAGGATVLAVTEAQSWRLRTTVLGAVCATGLGLWFSGQISPIGPPAYAVAQLENTGSGSNPAAIIFTYAMAWVALAFSALAMVASKPLQGLLGNPGRRRFLVLAVCFGFAAYSLNFTTSTAPRPTILLFSAALPVGLLAALPLAVWVRRVMPELRSVAVWIILPVIMYSCFWVILGPIDLNGFPYDRLTEESLLSGS